MELDLTYEQVRKMMQMVNNIRTHVSDVLLECSSKYLTIFNMDDSHILLVYGRIKGKYCDNFQCDQPTTIGINLKQLYPMLKSVKKDEQTRLFLSRIDDQYQLGIKFSGHRHNGSFYLDNINVNSDFDYKTVTDHLLKLPIQIRLSSKEWRCCLERFQVLDHDAVELKYSQGTLTLAVGHQNCILDIEVTDIIKDESRTTSNFRLDLEKLIQIAKCSLFSDQLVIYFHDSELCPIFFLYSIDQLGFIIYGLSPRNEYI